MMMKEIFSTLYRFNQFLLSALLFVLTVNAAADHTLLEFRKISQINLILKYESVQIPTDDIVSEMQILLDELRDYNCTSAQCENGRSLITNALSNKNSTLMSLFVDGDDKALNRKKRSWDPIGKGLKWAAGVMDSDDRQVLTRKVNILYDNQKTIYEQLESVIEGLDSSKPPEALKAERDGLSEVEINLKHVQELIGLQAMSERYEKITAAIDGIWRTFFNKKIDGIFVTPETIEKLKDLPNLACASIIDCVRNADADVQFENLRFTINLRIPLVSDRHLKLYETTSIPSDLNSHILLLKFPQKYFAYDENNKKLISVNENSFHLCKKSSNDDSKSTIMYCRAKDIIANVNSDECLEKAFRDKTVDSSLCSEKMELLHASDFGVIEIGKGKFWAHIAKNSRKDMVMYCDKNDHEVKTFTSSQVFSLVFGCHGIFRADGIDLTSYVADETRRLKTINASISNADFIDIIDSMSVSNFLKNGFEINLQAYQPKGLNPIPLEIEVKHQTATTSSELKTLRAQHSEALLVLVIIAISLMLYVVMRKGKPYIQKFLPSSKKDDIEEQQESVQTLNSNKT